jgi:vacuolar-type H+-ATPase subunit I/STV1
LRGIKNIGGLNIMNIIKKDDAKIALAKFVGNNFEFEKINGAIERLASVENLTTEDKKQAVSAIEEWEKLTIKRIDSKKDELQAIVNLINNKQIANWEFEKKREQLEKLATIAGAQKLFEKTDAAIKKYEEKREEEPEKYEFDDEISRNENLLKQQDSEKKMVIYSIEKKKLEKIYLNASKELMKTVAKNESIKSSVLAAESFIRDADKLSRICRDKSALAKINVLVSNKELKESLKEMMNFSIENETF